jgi:hypothetical protein
MPSFGSGYRGDMTPPEKKPTLEEINAELLAALIAADEELRLIRLKDTDAVYDTMVRTQIKNAIARATAAQSDINMGR